MTVCLLVCVSVLLCFRLEGQAERLGLGLRGADQRSRQQPGSALSAPEGGAVPGNGPVSAEGGQSLSSHALRWWRALVAGFIFIYSHTYIFSFTKNRVWLQAQLKKRSDAEGHGDTVVPSQLSRSPKSPFLPRATRVLPPPGGGKESR